MGLGIIEVSSILEDFRIDTIGGLKSGLDIFEIANLPSLLNNEQSMMYRQLFAVPNSTHTQMLRMDLGSINMKERIDQKKLNFLHHLRNLESETLAAEIYELQVKYNFPGLVGKCRKLIVFYGLPNIIDEQIVLSKQSWKKLVKEAILKKSEKAIKLKMQSYSKLRDKDYG